MYYPSYHTRAIRPFGIPEPPPAGSFNGRIVFPGDISLLTETYRTVPHSYEVADKPSYPNTSGTILLTKPGNIQTYLTSNWQVAQQQAQLDATKIQNNPYFTTGVFAKTNTKPRLSTGHKHSHAIRSNGQLLAWGNDTQGQLGNDATLANKSTPVQSGSSTAWLMVDGAEEYTVGVRSDGTLAAAGDNQYGQLGLGHTNYSPTWTIVAGSDWFSASAGSHHTLGLKRDGSVWGFGASWGGELNNLTTSTSSPTQMLVGNSNIAVSAGGFHSMALQQDGTILTWGLNQYGQLGRNLPMLTTIYTSDYVCDATFGRLTGFVAISAGGAYHSLALHENGTVWAWGYGSSGALGNQSSAHENVPVQVTGLSNIVAISAGSWHSLALAADGTLWAWGHDGNGQLGNPGVNAGVFAPIQITSTSPASSNSDWIAIAAGDQHSLAMKADGRVFAWGENIDGRLGAGSTGAPIQIPTLNQFNYSSVALSPANGSTYNMPNSLILTASVSGSMRRVEFYSGTSKFFEDATSPYQVTIGVGTGIYNFQARAIDNFGIQCVSSTNTVTIGRVDAILSSTASGNITFSNSNKDWAHWGRDLTTSYNHRAGITSLISNATTSGTVSRITSNAIGFIWSNGTPTATQSTATTTSISVSAVNNFFQFTVPATANPQTVKVYVSAFKAKGSLTASINDGSNSSATISLDSPSSGTAPSYRIFTVTFASAVASGRFLTVKWNLTTLNATGGDIRIHSASLQ